MRQPPLGHPTVAPHGATPSSPSRPSDSSLEPSGPFSVEIFCGCANLSLHLGEVGFQAFPIDWAGNRFKTKVPFTSVDLTVPSGQARIWKLLSSPLLSYVHMSPPCGTASRAREKPIPAAMRARGFPNPQPLRSEAFPLGLPNLAKDFPNQVARVRSANVLYQLCSEVATFCSHRGVPWTLENPSNSIFWFIPHVEALLELPCVGDIRFHHCMHGGRRDKLTRLRSSPSAAFSVLAVECDKSHEHLPWGISSFGKLFTADEAEFPDLLCSRLARAAYSARPELSTVSESTTTPIMTSAISSSSLSQPSGPPRHSVSVHTDAADPAAAAHVAQRVAAAVQPRGAHVFSVIPEFRERIWLPASLSLHADPKDLVGTPVDVYGGRTFPKGSKIIALRMLGGESGSAYIIHRLGKTPASDTHDPPDPHAPDVPSVMIGVAWTPDEFVERSLTLKHPFDSVAVEDGILRSVFTTLIRPPSATRQLREATLAVWRDRALALEERETELRGAVHHEVRPSISGKRLLLFGEMLSASGFPRPSALVHRMASGFPLLGNIEATGVFPPKTSDASATIEDLWRNSRSLQNLAISAMGPSSDPKLDEAVSEATQEEVGKGWLLGPFTREELSAKHGLWVPVRRFGIWQGGGSRVIDDYSEYGQNNCTSTVEKIDVGGVDVVASLARGVLAAVVSEERTVRVDLSDGMTHQGTLHESWSVGDAKTLVGKVWDLSKAYRQLARAPCHASVSIVVTWNSRSNRVEMYEQPVLPFGAKASVWDFNWVARGLKTILVNLFGLVVTHYFDDYPVLEFAVLEAHTQHLVDSVLELLGWDTKAQLPFSPRFEPLGVICDMTQATNDLVRFMNKDKRLKELETDIDRIIASGCIRRGEARSLRGRVQFARCQTFGRCGAVAMKYLGYIADGTKASPNLDRGTADALRWLLGMLKHSRPRELQARPPPPVLLFVDGACDQTPDGIRVSIGAVLFDPLEPGSGPRYFGTLVGEPLVRQWSNNGDKEQLIGQAELLPVLLAKSIWKDVFKNRPNITFIDNDSARYGLIRGYSPVLDSSRIISESWMFDAVLGTASWFARVPTASNIADAPSRLDFTALERMSGSKRYDVSVPSCWGQGDLWSAVASWLARDL